MSDISFGITIPFLGTALGALCVYIMKNQFRPAIRSLLNGFASGVMVAASVWSLLIPAIAQCDHLGGLSFLPAVAGLWSGVIFLILLSRFILKLKKRISNTKSPSTGLHKTVLLALAVVLHNIPEGMAVGAAFSAVMMDQTAAEYAAAISLAVGIAIQNIPEGAIISMPAHAQGIEKHKAFLCGLLSGAVEPVAAWLTILLSSLIVPLLPYFLSFAAGAMLWVVVSELIPESASDQRILHAALAFCAGFTVMMTLDVALG